MPQNTFGDKSILMEVKLGAVGEQIFTKGNLGP